MSYANQFIMSVVGSVEELCRWECFHVFCWIASLSLRWPCIDAHLVDVQQDAPRCSAVYRTFLVLAVYYCTHPPPRWSAMRNWPRLR